MIIHRAYRDIQRCRQKYGESWEEYEKLVPYLFIPVRLPSAAYFSFATNALEVCFLKRLDAPPLCKSQCVVERSL
jgi:hypothetical protein